MPRRKPLPWMQQLMEVPCLIWDLNLLMVVHFVILKLTTLFLVLYQLPSSRCQYDSEFLCIFCGILIVTLVSVPICWNKDKRETTGQNREEHDTTSVTLKNDINCSVAASRIHPKSEDNWCFFYGFRWIQIHRKMPFFHIFFPIRVRLCLDTIYEI